MADDLTPWLLGQLTRDQQAARALPNAIGGLQSRFSPAKLIADCEAKRRIVGLHTPGDRDRDCPECTDRDYRGSAGMPLVWCDTLKLLALPYADRPGYREEWRP